MPAPSVRALLAPSLDPATGVVILLAALSYVVGVRRLRHRGRRWRRSRSLAFAAGLVALAVATQSGLARYDTEWFSLHAVQHLLLGMVAPLLLALGAPVTLALQAGAPGTQRGLLRLLHSRPVATLTHPVVGWALFGGTLFALYFSPLFELSLGNELAHAAMHLHFIVAGSLFFWPLVGLDPVRWRLPHGARLAAVLLAVPFHAFLGLALLGADRPLGGGPWSVADQRTGAGILWATGELLALATAAIVFVQWAGADEREAVRADRRADRRADAGRSEVERRPA